MNNVKNKRVVLIGGAGFLDIICKIKAIELRFLLLMECR